jgi:glycosyltransferase involved in cell wall biosynthesis
MRILFVSTIVPVPANNGQAIRTLSIVQGFIELGHEVSFVGFGTNAPAISREPLASQCRDLVIVERVSSQSSQSAEYAGRLVSLLKRKAHGIERFRSSAMKTELEKLIAANNFDLVVADTLYNLVNIPQTDIPLLLNTHNVEYRILDRYAALESNPAKRKYAWLEARNMQRAEKDALGKARMAFACSDTDRQELTKLNGAVPIYVVPNCVATDFHARAERAIPGRMLFVGGMDWYPNRDAVEFFVENIFPAITAQAPEAHLVVAGRNPPKDFVQRIGRTRNVVFTGTVPSMHPCLEQASVVVVPLRLGSGTRLKILEACAAGKAVVSTSVGAEGLNLAPGKDIQIADNAGEFANGVVGLLRDSSRREQMANAGREKIVAGYSLAALRRSMEVALNELNMGEPLTSKARVV